MGPTSNDHNDKFNLKFEARSLDQTSVISVVLEIQNCFKNAEYKCAELRLLFSGKLSFIKISAEKGKYHFLSSSH